jgi:hypothetical protein
LPLPFGLSWPEVSLDSLDFELRDASYVFRLPGEAEQLFEVLAMAESNPEAALSSVTAAAAFATFAAS